MTDEETYTYGVKVKSHVGRDVLKALRAATIPSRVVVDRNRYLQPGESMTIFVKPERAARLDKFVARFDRG